MELEVGLLCEQFHCSPDRYGYDSEDPRVMRGIRISVQLYHAATDRMNAKKKIQWDKENPGGAKLIKGARGGGEIKLEPGEVRIALPERPKK